MNNRSLRSNLYTLALVNTLRISSPGVAESNKALIVDTNKDLSGIRNLTVQNLNVGGSLLTASATELNYVDTTPGIGESFRALVLDGNNDISNINSLSAIYLTGTLQTASQPNITSLGTLSNLNIQGNLNIINHNGSNTGLRLNNTLITASATEINKLDGLISNTTELNILSGITANVTQLNYTNTTQGLAEAEKALIVDTNRDITNIRNLTASNLTGTLITTSQPNITSVGTLNNLTVNGNVNIATHNGSTSGLELNGTLILSTATEINYLKDINPGTVIGNKVLAVDNNKDLLGFRDISLNGNLSTAQITLNGFLIQSTADEINYLYNITKGLASNNKAVILDTNKDFSGIRNLTIDNLIISGSNLQLPSGNTASRPITPSLGYIRYNTETSQFEGYGAGNNWGSLGGVINVEQTTKILAENSPGSNDNNLRFINNNVETMRITSTGNIGINNNNPSYKLDITGTLNCTSNSNFRDTMNIYKTGSNNNSVVSSLILRNNYSLASASGLGIGIDFWMPDSTGNQLYSGSLNCVITNPVTANFANKFEFKLYNAGTINTAASIDSTGLLIISSLSTSTITATNNVNISSHNGSTSGLQLNGTLVTATANELNYNDITTIGTAQASKALIVDSNKDIQSIRRLHLSNISIGTSDFTNSNRLISAVDNSITNSTARYLCLGKSYSTHNTAEWGYYHTSDGSILNRQEFGFYGANGIFTITTGRKVGINNTSPSYDLDVSGDINLTGTLRFSGTSLTATVNDINKLTSITEGTVSANKVLIVDSNKDLTGLRNLSITGNLTVAGTVTTINSTQITIQDNILQLNSGPSGSYDSGLIIQRYQTNNDSNIGDIINETAKENYIASSVTINIIVLPSNANSNDNYYNNWWIKIVSATTGSNQVRQILSYNGTTKTITLTNNFTTLPTGIITINLYNKSFSNLIWQESNKRFVTSYTSQDISSGTLTILDYADLATNNLNIISNTDASSSSNGGSLTVSGGAAIAKKLYIGSDLSVTGNSNLLGTMLVTGNSTLSGTLTVTGSSTINNNLSASGLVSFTNITDAINSTNGGSLTVSGGAAISKKLYIGSDLSVTGNSNLSGTLSVTGNSILSGTLSITGSGTFNNNLSVSGLVSFNNITDSTNSTNGGSLTVSGGAAIAKKLYIGSDLSVTGNSTLSGTLSVSGNSTLSGTLLVTNSGTFNSSLTVSGSTILNSILSVTGNSTLSGTLSVTGSSTLNNTLSVSGLVSFTNVTDSSSSISGGSLTVSGGAAIAKKLYIGSDLSVTGNSTLSGTLTINNNSTVIGTLSVSGLSTFSNGLTITGSGTFNNALSVSGLVSFTNITDASNSTTGGSLTISGGAAIAKKLYIGSDLSVTGNSIMTGTVTLNNTLSVNNNTTLSGSLTISGISNINNTLAVSGLVSFTNVTDSTNNMNGGSLTVSGGASIAKKLYIGSDLSVSGNSNLLGTMVVTGNSTLSGTLTVTGSSTINNNLSASGLVTFTNITDATNSTNGGSLTVSGGVAIAKKLYIGSNLSVTGNSTLSGTLSVTGNITGTLATANQPNITSIGTLTSLSTNSLTLNGIAITATANDINALSGIIVGNATANKVLIVDSNLDLSGIRNLSINGNLTVAGTTTTINSTQINLKDNILQLNSGPSGSYDSGLIIQRYQTSNDSNTGDIINETAKENYTASSVTINTIVLPSNANSNNNYYNGWWIKITAATIGVNQIRQISSYAGSTKTITLFSNFTTLPTGTIIVNLYNKSFSNLIWQESNKRFITSYTAQDISSGTLTILDYADLATNNLNIISNIDATNSTTGGSLTIAGGAAIAKKLYIGTDLSVSGNSSLTGTLTVNNTVTFNNITDSTNSTTGGSLTIAGGVAIAKKLYVGSSINSTSDIVTNTILKSTSSGYGLRHINGGVELVTYIDSASSPATGYIGTSTNHRLILQTNGTNRMSITNTGIIDIPGSTASTSSGTGNLTIAGGIGISNTTDATSVNSGGSLTTAGGMAIAKKLYIGSDLSVTSNSSLTGTLTVTGITTLNNNLSISGTVIFSNITDAISSTSGGSLTISGGTSIAKKLYVGSDLLIHGNSNLTGTLSVTNNTILSGTLSVTGNSIFSGSLEVTGATTINNTLSVTGNSTLSSLSITSLTLNGTLIISTATDINKLANVTATSTELNYTDTTIGIAEATKALIVDANKDITSIRNLTATNLTGTILTASQPNITSIGTLTSLTVNGNIISSTANAAFRIVPHTDNIIYLQAALNITTGSATDLFIGNYNNTTSASSRKIMFKADGKVGLGTASPGYTLDVIGDINLTGSLRFSGAAITATATELNYLSGITLGTASASKSLILDSNRNITNINNISTTGVISTIFANNTTNLNTYQSWTNDLATDINVVLRISNIGSSFGNTSSHPLRFITNNTNRITIDASGNVDIVSHNGSSTGLELGGILITATAIELNILDGITATTDELNILDGLTATTAELNILDGLTATTTELNYLDIITIGTAEASKALIVDSLRNINNINSLSCTSLTVNGSVISTSGTELNYLSGIITGTADASKALVVDANKDITSIRNLTATNLTGTNLTGTIQTSNQPNITTVGTLTSLSTGNITLNGSLITATATELNYTDITTIGTAQASKALILDSSRNITNINNMSLTGTLTVGTVGSGPNRINFSGTTGDASNNHTVIAERIYNSTEQSELLIFKGNDHGLSGAGPDRIRFRAAEFRFQTYTSAEDYSGLIDNNDRLYINNNGNIGIGTISPGYLLDVNGSINSTSLYINGTVITATATKLNYNDITTIGIAEASKALIVDINKDIISIRNLTATNLTGTIQTASQPNITSVGTLTSLSTNSLTLNGTEIIATAADINKLANITSSTAELNILYGVTATAAELNYNDITSIGTAEASKALIVDVNKDIISIRNLTATNLTGTIQTASQPNITSVGTLTSLTVSGNIISSTANAAFRIVPNADNIVYLQVGLTTTSSSAADLFIGNYNNSTTTSTRKIIFKADGKVGLGTASPGYALDVIGDINLTGSIRFSGTAITATAAELNILDGVTATTTELNYTDITTIGTAQASKALIVDANKDIISIRNLTATNLTGTIQTGSQPNITSIGTLTSLSTNSLTLNGTVITATANELNYNDITTIGTAEANKALIVDSNKDIISIRNLTATNLTGIIQTANQPNITSVGTLTSLSTNSLTLNGTAITATATELNYTDITTIGTAEASKALILDSSRNISNINNISLNGNADMITLTNSISNNRTNLRFINDIKSWELGSRGSTNTNPNSFYLYDNTASAYRLIINTSGSINIVNHNGSSTGLQLNGTLVTATAAELNILDGVTATTAELNWLDTTAGSAQASKALVLDINKDISGINNLSLTGTLTVGTVGSGPNRINFSGTTGDASSNYTVIAERIYNSTEQSELLLFKGNDSGSTDAGPDRIRLRAAEFRFQTYTSAEDYSGLLDNNDRLYINNSGNVGIGTTSPQGFLDFGNRASNYTINLYQDGTNVYGFGANDNALKYLSAGSNGHVWYTSSTLSSTGAERMRIMSSGNVGIGTISPSYTLDVNGTIRSLSNIIGTTNIRTNNYMYVSDTGNFGRYIGNWTAGSWGIGAHNSTSVRIGKCSNDGIWSGYADVHMQRPNLVSNGYGLSHRNSDSSSVELVSYNDGITTGIGSYSSHSFRIIASDSWRIRCEPNGDVVRSTGSTSFTSGSDIRLKEDIINADLNLCYNNIKELRLVYYKWKDFTYENTDISLDKHRLGWIAQELETVLPKSVTISNNYGLEDCKHINVDQIYATLYGCTKKIINDKEILEEKVNNLENENQQLKNQIENQNILINQILERLQNLENNN